MAIKPNQIPFVIFASACRRATTSGSTIGVAGRGWLNEARTLSDQLLATVDGLRRFRGRTIQFSDEPL